MFEKNHGFSILPVPQGVGIFDLSIEQHLGWPLKLHAVP